jgi:hypothetical protein
LSTVPLNVSSGVTAGRCLAGGEGQLVSNLPVSRENGKVRNRRNSVIAGRFGKVRLPNLQPAPALGSGYAPSKAPEGKLDGGEGD